MSRPTVATVSLDAIAHNLRAVQGLLSRESAADAAQSKKGMAPAEPHVIAVVKANAYGHGAERVGLALEAAGASMLACADIEEGVLLRRAGVTIPVLVFGAMSVSDL